MNVSIEANYSLAISRVNYYLFSFNIFAQVFHFSILTVWLSYGYISLSRVKKQIRALDNADCNPCIRSNHTNRKYELYLFIIIALIELAYFLLNLLLTLFVLIYDEPIRSDYLTISANCTLVRGTTIGEAYNPAFDNFIYTGISPVYCALLLLLVWVIYLSIWRINIVLRQSLSYREFDISELKVYQLIPVGIVQGGVFVFLNFHRVTQLASYPLFCVLFQINLVLLYREFRRFCGRYNQWILDLKRDNESMELRKARFHFKTYKLLVPCIWGAFQFYFLHYMIFSLHVWVETVLFNSCFFEVNYGITLPISLSETDIETCHFVLRVISLLIQLMRTLFYLVLVLVYIILFGYKLSKYCRNRKPIPRYRLEGNYVIRIF